MYAIEFETVIKDKYIELKNFDDLMNKHVRIILLVEEDSPGIKRSEGDELVLKKIFQDAENIIIDSDIDINKISNEVNL